MPLAPLPEVPGTEYPIMIDGIPLNFFPSDLPMPPNADATVQKMLDGSNRFWQSRPFFSGVAMDHSGVTITIDLDSVKGDDRVNLRRIRSRGLEHLVTIWTYECITYSLADGVTRLYLPRRRKCAAHFYSGVNVWPERGVLADTTTFPTTATLDGDALTVSYAEGPTLASPGAGGIVIARQPDSAGTRSEGQTAMRLGDTPSGGELLEIWTFLTYQCAMTQTDIRLSRGLSEVHGYTFVEV